MPRDTVEPLSRPVSVDRLPPTGTEITVEATADEREALAREFKLVALHALTGRYRLTGVPDRVAVAGRVEAAIRQICVVTLEPFDDAVVEEVDVDFSAPESAPVAPPADGEEYEPPDEIVNGKIDLGALTAEFLALGLDPYPRKPDADFRYESNEVDPGSPFAALGRLRKDD